MSGLFKPLLIIFGLISSGLAAWIVARLGLFNNSDTLFREFRLFAFLRYLFWLTVEIGKADWAVTKAIVASELPNRQRLMAVPATQRTDVGKALFANSITITPGTVTVETEGDYFIVHALTDEAANQDALAEMNNRVCGIERGGQL